MDFARMHCAHKPHAYCPRVYTLVFLAVLFGCSDDAPSVLDGGTDAGADVPRVPPGIWPITETELIEGGDLQHSFPLPGGFGAIAGNRNLAFFSTESPDQPELTSYLRRRSSAIETAVVGNTVYLFASVPDVEGAYHLEVYNFTAGNEFEFVRSIPTPSIISRVKVAGRVLYSLSTDREVYDLSDPQAPVVVGELDAGERASDVSFFGGESYILFRDGIRVYTQSDPLTAVRFIAFLSDTLGGAIAADDQYVYIATDRTLRIFPRESDGTTEPISETPLSISPAHMTLLGSKLVLGVLAEPDGRKHTEVFDVADPSAPLLLGSMMSNRISLHWLALGDRLYRSDSVYSLTDVTGEPSGTLGPYFMEGLADLDGDSVCVVDTNRQRLHVIDLRLGFEFHSTLENVSPFPGAVLSHQGFCYVTRLRSVSIFDIRDPANPLQLDTQIELGSISDLFALGNTLVATGSMGDLTLLDISDPTAPVQVAEWSVPDEDPLAPSLEFGVMTDSFVFTSSQISFGEPTPGLFSLAWDAGSSTLTEVSSLERMGSVHVSGVFDGLLVSHGQSFDVASDGSLTPNDIVGGVDCTDENGTHFRSLDGRIERFDARAGSWSEVAENPSVPFHQNAGCDNGVWFGVTRMGLSAVPLSGP